MQHSVTSLLFSSNFLIDVEVIQNSHQNIALFAILNALAVHERYIFSYLLIFYVKLE